MARRLTLALAAPLAVAYALEPQDDGDATLHAHNVETDADHTVPRDSFEETARKLREAGEDLMQQPI